VSTTRTNIAIARRTAKRRLPPVSAESPGLTQLMVDAEAGHAHRSNRVMSEI
jgi:hypothetical protein